MRDNMKARFFNTMIMGRKESPGAIFLFLFLGILLFGCTTQNFVPGRPLQKGEHEIRAGFSYSLNKMSFNSVQLSLFYGIDRNHVVGASFNNFLLPGNLSFARYWTAPYQTHSIQLHFNDLFGSAFNPAYEIDYGYSWGTRNREEHSWKVGIGYYAEPPVHLAVGNRLRERAFIPVAGYQFRAASGYFDLQWLPGMTEYFIHYYKENYLIHPRNEEADNRIAPVGLRYAHAEIDTIIKKTTLYKIAFLNGDTLILADRDPYPDCFACGVLKRFHEAYTASESHKLYWLHWPMEDSKHNAAPRLLELNMPEILERYRRGGDLYFREDDNLAAKSYLRAGRFWNDLLFSAGWYDIK